MATGLAPADGCVFFQLLLNVNALISSFMSPYRVFKYSVEVIDLKGESLVDAEWMAYLGAFRYLRSMILADCHKINNAALWNITGAIMMNFLHSKL